MKEVVPELAKVFEKYPGDKIHTDEAITALTEAGLEVHGVVWTAEFGLTNRGCQGLTEG